MGWRISFTKGDMDERRICFNADGNPFSWIQHGMELVRGIEMNDFINVSPTLSVCYGKKDEGNTGKKY